MLLEKPISPQSTVNGLLAGSGTWRFFERADSRFLGSRALPGNQIAPKS